MIEDNEGPNDKLIEGTGAEKNPKIVDLETWKRKRLAERQLQQLRDFELLDKAPDELTEPGEIAKDGD